MEPSIASGIKKRLPKSLLGTRDKKAGPSASSATYSNESRLSSSAQQSSISQLYSPSSSHEVSNNKSKSPTTTEDGGRNRESSSNSSKKPHTRQSSIRETKRIVKDVDELGNKMVNHFVILKELGRGVHGKVKLCKDANTGKEWAIKILEKNPRRRFQSKLSQAYRMQLEGQKLNAQLEKIKREIAILKKCSHPNIVGLREVIDDPSSDKIYLILEYLPGGEVQWQDFASETPKPIHTESAAMHIFRDLVSGVQYLHHQGIVHRDIKPANLLWDGCGHVKITDFGVSVFVGKKRRTLQDKRDCSPDDQEQPTDIDNELELAKTAGSPAFFAPELCLVNDADVLLDTPSELESETSAASLQEGTCISFESSSNGLGRPSASKQSKRRKEDRIMLSADKSTVPAGAHIDIWAMGVTLYCLIFGQVPFLGQTEFELFHIIVKQPLHFPSHVPISDDLGELLSQMLNKDPNQRILMEEIRFHSWTTADLGKEERMSWLHETDVHHQFARPLIISDEDVKDALTIIEKLQNGIRKISSSFQNLASSFVKRSSSQSFLSSKGGSMEDTDRTAITLPSNMSALPLSLESRFKKTSASKTRLNGPVASRGPSESHFLDNRSSDDMRAAWTDDGSRT